MSLSAKSSSETCFGCREVPRPKSCPQAERLNTYVLGLVTRSRISFQIKHISLEKVRFGNITDIIFRPFKVIYIFFIYYYCVYLMKILKDMCVFCVKKNCSWEGSAYTNSAWQGVWVLGMRFGLILTMRWILLV